jgi:hypothetical protein
LQDFRPEGDCALLGCAGMVELQRSIADELGIPVVDGVAAAVKLVECPVALGLRTSKAGGRADPLPKPYGGAFAVPTDPAAYAPWNSPPSRRAARMPHARRGGTVGAGQGRRRSGAKPAQEACSSS